LHRGLNLDQLRGADVFIGRGYRDHQSNEAVLSGEGVWRAICHGHGTFSLRLRRQIIDAIAATQ
jgi:hypothetical protein